MKQSAHSLDSKASLHCIEIVQASCRKRKENSSLNGEWPVSSGTVTRGSLGKSSPVAWSDRCKARLCTDIPHPAESKRRLCACVYLFCVLLSESARRTIAPHLEKTPSGKAFSLWATTFLRREGDKRHDLPLGNDSVSLIFSSASSLPIRVKWQ